MIEPFDALAFSLHANKGAYALLLGSGVSRSAGIPTGWEVTLDLIRRLARLRQEDCEPEPAEWYHRTAGRDPEYSTILQELGHTPHERRGILHSYFEPTEEERRDGLKLPRKAHEAIADLASTGFIRVILTTNFDRLFETAFEARGLSPAVISTPDAAEGMRPLVHEPHTIIKLHGDCRDARILNTVGELSVYDPRLDSLLDKVFDEYGLVVCGWSADWDGALRAAIERAPNRRYTTFWCHRGALTDSAEGLIGRRSAERIPIRDADSFFVTLRDRVLAIADLGYRHPVSSSIATARVKRYLSSHPIDRIGLEDLFREEQERAYRELLSRSFSADKESSGIEGPQRPPRYEAITEVLRGILMTSVYYGSEDLMDLWVRCLERIARARGREGLSSLLYLQGYPGMLLMYAFGVGAVARGEIGLVGSVITNVVAESLGAMTESCGFAEGGKVAYLPG